MTEKRNRRKSIGHRALVGIVCFALLLTIAVGVSVSYCFGVISFRHYNRDTIDYACIVAHSINGDRLEKYTGNGDEDEYYRNAEEFLTSILEELELTNIAVYVPHEDYMLCIWDISNDWETSDYGYREEYSSESYKETVMNALMSDPSEGQIVMLGTDDGILVETYASVRNSKDEPVGVVSIVRPEPELRSIISQFVFAILAVVALVSVITMFIVYRLLYKQLIKPVRTLTRSVENMVDNLEYDETVSIDVHTNDELESLADAFVKMDSDLREYIKELSEITTEKERIGAELNVAASIQIGMLPKMREDIACRKEFDLAVAMFTAKEVGGDFYDFFMVDDDHIALVIADVSGKSVPAALFMVVSKVLLKNSLKDGMGPGAALSNVNEKLLENNDIDMFVTVWMAVIDLKTGKGISANAGHEHPAIRQSGGSYELVKYKHSPVLAAFNEAKFKEREFTMKRGDSLVVYTDGITESTDMEGRMFGEERLLDALNINCDADPEELLRTVKASVDEFVCGAPQFDDITMLAFRYNGKQ